MFGCRHVSAEVLNVRSCTLATYASNRIASLEQISVGGPRLLDNDDVGSSRHRELTLPIGGGVGKIIKLGKLPINLQVQAFDNVLTPQWRGANWLGTQQLP